VYLALLSSLAGGAAGFATAFLALGVLIPDDWGVAGGGDGAGAIEAGFICFGAVGVVAGGVLGLWAGLRPMGATDAVHPAAPEK
jgi:hypothetical protein